MILLFCQCVRRGRYDGYYVGDSPGMERLFSKFRVQNDYGRRNFREIESASEKHENWADPIIFGNLPTKEWPVVILPVLLMGSPTICC
jgi:hypothetical protein